MAALVSPVLRLNMSGSSDDPEIESTRYAAAIAMAEYADRNGFAIVNVEEHHDADIGWMGSPLLMSALIISRTQRITVRASALLVTLYDPVRLAEEIALLRLLSGYPRVLEAAAEAGEPLTLDRLRGIYRELLDAYFGPRFVIDKQLELECLRIPHFYNAFYVYKYATGLSAAITLAKRVAEGGPQELEALRRG